MLNIEDSALVIIDIQDRLVLASKYGEDTAKNMTKIAKAANILNIPTIVSMNPIMVDGTGMCGACRVTVGEEVKFACVDGPEFDAHQVDFDEMLMRLGGYREQEREAMERTKGFTPNL